MGVYPWPKIRMRLLRVKSFDLSPQRWGGLTGVIIPNLDTMDLKSILSLLEIANFEKQVSNKTLFLD